MNFLKRSLTLYLSHSSRPSRRCLFLLRPVAQSSMYYSVQKLNNPQLTKPRTTQKAEVSPSYSSSFTSAQGDQKRAGSVADWPRPSEIPYQAKVVNLVNLIGQITTPVKFQIGPNGKPLAGAVISQNSHPSVVIPVVFEGDLAHVVDSHVKKNDCVYVAGRLSEDPLPFGLGEYQGNFHLVAENINFVEGFENNPWKKKNVVPMPMSMYAGGASISAKKRTFKHENDDFENRASKTVESEVCEPKIYRANLKSGETEKNGDNGSDHWTDLVKNPSQWRDYREPKANGLLKEKYPDFKHKDNGTALWLNTAPQWVLQELKNGEKSEEKEVKASRSTEEDSWRSLVEDPSKWWDNRVGKRNAKAPDFKHKETGQALWLNGRLPSWVLSKLPALKGEKKGVAAGGK